MNGQDMTRDPTRVDGYEHMKRKREQQRRRSTLLGGVLVGIVATAVAIALSRILWRATE